MSVFGKRLAEARKVAKISQEKLGIDAGIDPGSASARMNQYERGIHEPNLTTVNQIANALGLPVAYFFTEMDDAAKLLVIFHRLPAQHRAKVLDYCASLGVGF